MDLRVSLIAMAALLSVGYIVRAQDSGAAEAERYTKESERQWVRGESSVLQGCCRGAGERILGAPLRGRFVWADTWIHRIGKWQIVAAEGLIARPNLENKRARPHCAPT
jgi:hypothetical protein